MLLLFLGPNTLNQEMEGEEGKKEENSLVSIPSAYLFFSARIMVRNPEFPHAMLVRVHCIRSESL